MRTFSDRLVFDDAVWRLGLKETEIFWLLESMIERGHAERHGVLVRANVIVDEMGSCVSVYEPAPFGSLESDRELRFFYRPSPEDFRRAIEEYSATKTSIAGWEIALARCVQVCDGYSLVELTENERLDGEVAVLPRAMQAWADHATWQRGQERYVAAFQPRPEQIDGGQAWQKLSPRWVTTRRHSIFLRLLLQRFLSITAHTEIVGDSGMIVISPSGPAGELIGTGGANIRALV